MAKIILTLLVVVVAGHLCFGDDENCGRESLRPCESNMDVATRRVDGVLPDEAFLDEHCEGLISKFECVDAAQQSCLNTDTTSSDLQMLKDYVRELCDKNSELRRDFITSSTCLNSHHEDVRKKVQDSMQILMIAFYRTNDIDPTFRLEVNSLKCFRMEFSLLELYNAAKEYCGIEAKKIITDIVEILVANIPDNPCDETDESYQHYKSLLDELISS